MTLKSHFLSKSNHEILVKDYKWKKIETTINVFIKIMIVCYNCSNSRMGLIIMALKIIQKKNQQIFILLDFYVKKIKSN